MLTTELIRKPETPAAKIDRLKKELAKLEADSIVQRMNRENHEFFLPNENYQKKLAKEIATLERIKMVKQEIQELEAPEAL